jgi:ferredoxin-NADP reductase
VPVRLVYSSRSYAGIIYREELTQLGRDKQVEIFLTLTREWPDDWPGHRRRIDGDLLREISWAPSERPLVYICGSNSFVEQAANALLALGYDAMSIKTERFGPTGS